MADDESTATAEAKGAKAASSPEEKEDPTYHIDRLIPEAEDFLGVPSYVAAGAFAGETKKNFTIPEAKKIVKDWLKKPVEEDQA